MQWITALLAFAVTMLVFAMVTSALVESIHRVLALRASGLRVLLGNVFDQAIRPHLAGVLAPTDAGHTGGAPAVRLDPATDAARKAFVEHMIQNRATRPMPSATGAGWRRRLIQLIDRFTDRFFGVTHVPVEVFTQKLADARFDWKASGPSDDIVTDIAQKYEAFGQEASVYFESRARLLSVIVAIPVAWMFFVHPQKLAVVYTKNPEVAQAVADQAAKVSAEYEALRERISGTAAGADVKDAVERLRTELKDASRRSKELAAVGVPLGWPAPDDQVPACGASAPPEAGKINFVGACRYDPNGANLIVPTWSGAFWLTLGGLLIGLGAPFWARSVSAMTAARTGSWQRFAQIVGTSDATAASAPHAAAAPRSVSNRTFAVARAATTSSQGTLKP